MHNILIHEVAEKFRLGNTNSKYDLSVRSGVVSEPN